MVDREVVIVSNRGPVSFDRGPDGQLRARRGAGGLVSGLGPVVSGSSTIWLAAALSDGDRDAAVGGVIDAEGFRVVTLALDPGDYHRSYDLVCNATLWYLHHGLFDLARDPVFDRPWWEAWDAYRRVNDAFAEAVAATAPPDAAVLVQDYHLALLGPRLAALRPDLRTVHFSHTPFAGPEAFRVLPDAVGREVLEGMTGHHACGFHTQRWADSFAASCEAVLGHRPTPFVAPLGPDPADLAAVLASPAGRDAGAALDRQLGERQLIARVDRIELSKNLLRGFQAYGSLLEDHPEWQGRVVFGAFVYPSREALPGYRSYRQEVQAAVAAVNERWATPGWEPIVYDDSDDFPRSVTALRRADVLLVNPIRDGLNLVAKEGALVNERDATLVLSTEAGAWAELDQVAVGINPYDVRATAEALHAALSRPADARRTSAAALRVAAAARTPAQWLADQLAAANRGS